MIYIDKVSVVIPAHNEEENIEILVEKIRKTFTINKINGEVILIDDGSTDNTGKIADKLCKKNKFLRVFHHRTKLGISESLNTSFKNLTGDTIVFIPSDLQSDPEDDIPKLLNKIHEGYDVVVGWREKWGRPKLKIIESKIYSYLSRKLFGVKIHDFNWIRAFKKDVIKDMYLRKDWHRYFVVLAASKGFKISEVKVVEHKRPKGKSKFNFKRVITGFLDLFVVKFYISFTESPMLFFGTIGIILLGLGVILGLDLFVLWLMKNPGITTRPAFFLMTLLIITGAISFAIGFLAEMIATLREDMKRFGAKD